MKAFFIETVLDGLFVTIWFAYFYATKNIYERNN